MFPEAHAVALRDALDRAPGAKTSAHFFFPAFEAVRESRLHPVKLLEILYSKYFFAVD